jgi:leucyl-tRNA synthetase
MQRAWIGRSAGSLVTFALQSDEGSAARALALPPLVIFTTRVETIYGASFPPSCKRSAVIHSIEQAALS